MDVPTCDSGGGAAAGRSAPTGRVALVTGGAGRFGAAVVQALAARGYAVAIHANRSLAAARETARLLEAAGLPSLAVSANMRDEGPVRAMVHRVADHFGRIDALVACAGVRRPGILEEVTADDLRAHFDVHCVGTVVTAQEAAAVMIAQEGGGTIVTIGDRDGDGPRRDSLAASCAAGAVPVLTRCLALELAERHPRVRVYCVLPGPPPAPPGPDDRPERVARKAVFLLEECPLTGFCVPLDGDA